MSLIQEIKVLTEKAGLSESEKKELEDFVDNYIGTTNEGYIPNQDYYNLHRNQLKVIWRKFKECSIFGSLINVLRPHINKGILALLE